MANQNSIDIDLTPGSGSYQLPASSDTLVGRDSSDTLTNKAIDADSNTIINIGSSEIVNDIITGHTLESSLVNDDRFLIYDASAAALRETRLRDIRDGLDGDLIDGKTADGSPDGANDYVLTYDASAAGLKKVLLDDLPGGSSIANVVEDTTPQLGGPLDVNGNKIVSTSNGDIDIEPNGTGNVLLGNFTLDADQTVGAGQDNYVMTYDHAAGTIGLEAAAGGGGSTYNVNNYFVDQSAGTSDTYGVLSGTINGSNTTFTVSQGEYASGTLEVYINGQLQTQGTSEDWDETTPGSGTFDFNTAPVSGDRITVRYAKTSSAAIPYTASIAWENPTDSDNIGGIFYEDAITITQINAVLVGSSTPSVTWTLKHSSDRSAAGNEVVTSGTTTTSTTSGSEVTSFNDATIPAGSWLWAETTAQSGTVTQIAISYTYTKD